MKNVFFLNDLFIAKNQKKIQVILEPISKTIFAESIEISPSTKNDWNIIVSFKKINLK